MLDNKHEMRNKKEESFYTKLFNYQKDCSLNIREQFDAFPVFSERQTITSFITRYELFKKIIDI